MDVLRYGGGGGIGSKVIAYVDGKVSSPYTWGKIKESFEAAEELYISVTKGENKSIFELEGFLDNGELTLVAKDLTANKTFNVRRSKENPAEIAVTESDGVDIGNAFRTKKKIDDYLYELSYDNIDYEAAREYFSKYSTIEPSGCTAVRNGGWYGRNYDWSYDDHVDFIVRTPAIGDRHATIGVCGLLDGLTREAVAANGYLHQYKYLPFSILDGINDCGVFCNANVVPLDKGELKESVPYLEKKDTINLVMVTRYILDNYSTAEDAVKDLADHIAVTGSASLAKLNYCTHFIVGDLNKTYIIEFIPDEQGIMRINYHEEGEGGTPYDNKIMTNFFLNDVIFNTDGTVYTPETQDATHSAGRTNNITPFGSGLERYNLVVQNYANCNSKEGMTDMMHQLDYRRAYASCGSVYGYGPALPKWNTEFVESPIAKGSKQLTTVDSPVKDYEYVQEYVTQLYLDRDRKLDPPTTWHTTHSSIYDLNKKKLYVFTSSESGIEYAFDFNEYYSAAEIDEKLGWFEVLQNGDVYVLGIGGYDGTNREEAKTLQQVINEIVGDK